MTNNTRADDRILGSLRSAEGKGSVRIEDRLDAHVGDVWSALTDQRRLARWLGEVEGDLRLGGASSAHTSWPAGGEARGAWRRVSPRSGCWC